MRSLRTLANDVLGCPFQLEDIDKALVGYEDHAVIQRVAAHAGRVSADEALEQVFHSTTFSYSVTVMMYRDDGPSRFQCVRAYVWSR